MALQDASKNAAINPAAFRISADNRNSGRKERVRTTGLAIQTPGKNACVRIHPSKEFHWEDLTAFEEDNNYYLIAPSLYAELNEEDQLAFQHVDFYVSSILQGDYILWPVEHTSARFGDEMRLAATSAKSGFVQVRSVSRSNGILVGTPYTRIPEPLWEGMQTAEAATRLFQKTFEGRLITTLDHRVLERIRARK